MARSTFTIGNLRRTTSAFVSASDSKTLYRPSRIQKPRPRRAIFPIRALPAHFKQPHPGVPANLQGLWNEHLLPPWSSNYTTNINVEENYWPAEVAALGELHETAMTGWINNLTESGTRTAQNYYGVDRGWCLGHNSDIWAMTNPIGLQTNSPSWACWNMGGAWVSTHIWETLSFQP